MKALRALACILMVATAVSGATVYTATLDESQEVPPTGSAATGTGMATLDDTQTMLMVSLSWTGLTGPAGAAHIHCCPGPGANATVAIDFVPAGFPNTDSGTFNHTFDLTDAASYGGGFLSMFSDVDAARMAVVSGLNSNLAYFNIHTDAHPGGEIRGDIQVVPEPATILLMGAGLGAIVLIRRRFV
jgi:hypothetical protein